MLLAATIARVIFAGPADPSFSGQLHPLDDRAAALHKAAYDLERSLVQRVREGDPTAFRTLMESHFSQATRLAHTFVHEHDVAEDIAQSVFAQIWARHHEWEPRVSVRAYILGAVRHRALNILKHRDIEARHAAQEIANDELGDSNVGDRLDRITQLTALYTAIAELPERRRVALTLRFEMELSYAEVGSTLGISAAAAKELIVRTVDALRVQLKELR